MPTLNDHFKQLNFYRANKSAETAQQFVAETKAMFRLFEKQPGLLTPEAFSILEYHAKTGPKVKDLDTMKPRQKRFPTDTMCQAAAELLGNIATAIPDKRAAAIGTLGNVISNSTDYTARNEALIVLDTLLFLNGKVDNTALVLMSLQCKSNNSPDIRRDAESFLRAAGKHADVKSQVQTAMGDMLQDPDAATRNRAVEYFIGEARAAEKLYEISSVAYTFNMAVAKIANLNTRTSLIPAWREINGKLQNKRDSEARAVFDTTLETLKKFKRDITLPWKAEQTYALLTAKNLIQRATPQELDILQAVAMRAMGHYDTRYNHGNTRGFEAAVELESAIFNAVPDQATAFDRIDRTMRENARDWRIQSGSLKTLTSRIHQCPFPPQVLETIEKCKNEGEHVTKVRNVAHDLLKSHAWFTAQKNPSAPGQG